MACGEAGHFAVEKGQTLINIRNKEGRLYYMLVVYALGRILILINLNIFILDESRNNLLCIQRL